MNRSKPTLVLLSLLFLIIACTQNREGKPTLTLVPTTAPSPPVSSPLSPLPLSPSPLPTPSSPPLPSPTPSPTATKPPPPIPTPLPTWPVHLPPLATPTPLPSILKPSDLLPPGAQLLADTVAPVAPDGGNAAVLLYRWPWFPTGSFWENTEVHIAQVPLEGRIYTPTIGLRDVPGIVHARRVDLDNDGSDDLLFTPFPSSTDVFEQATLLGWPRVLSRHAITFWGGYWGQKYERTPGWALTLHPVLYYPGPKALTFREGNGSGRWEADLAYSDEAGATIWKLAHYRWDPHHRAFRYTSTGARPADAPVPPSIYNVWIRQLQPLYRFSSRGNARLPVQRVEFRAYSVLHLDVDRDGSREWLLAYLAHPVYGTPEDARPNGQVDLALFDQQGTLLWTTARQGVYEKDTSGSLSDLGMRLVERTTADGRLEILHLLDVRWEGSGSYRQAWGVLYQAGGKEIHLVGRFLLDSGGRVGAGDSSHLGHSFWPNVKTGEWLLKRYVRMESVSVPGLEKNYTLHWPGAVAYGQADGKYVPMHFVSDGHTTHIRPSEYIYVIPYIAEPLDIDGHFEDWRQVEYMYGPEYAYFWGLFTGPPTTRLAWDTRYLYVATTTALDETVHVALDTDLEGDFNSGILNEDDHVISVHVQGCSVTMPPEKNGPDHVLVGTTLTRWRDRCRVEIGIPWATVGVDVSTWAFSPGYVYGSSRPGGHREYILGAGPIFGGAVWTKSFIHHPTDPRTWGTWIVVHHGEIGPD